jgi:hypothetical protein
MSTEVVVYSLHEMQVMAEAVAASGLFGMKSANQALALMLVAQSENRHPATVTQDYDIIQGKACRKTHSVMARFQHMGGKVEWHQLNDKIAEATFSHPAGGSLKIDWTIEQATKAGLAGKDNWRNYTRAMLRARVIAEGVRAVYPAAIGGMMVSEEAADAPMERDMGKAEVVETSHLSLDAPKKPALEEMSAAKFDENKAAWKGLIESGRKTASALITTLSTKATLTNTQKAAIRGWEVVEAEEVDEVAE